MSVKSGFFLLFTNVIWFPDKISLSWDDKKVSPALFLIHGWKEKKRKKEREQEREFSASHQAF